MAGRRTAEPTGGKANYDQCCAAELADIAQLSNRIGFGVNRGAVGAVGGTNTVLANRQDFAAAEQNRNVRIVDARLLGVAALMGENVCIQGAGDPRREGCRRVGGGRGGHVCGNPVEGTG